MHIYTAEDDRVARTLVEYCLQRLAEEVPLDRPLAPAELHKLAGETVTPDGIGRDETLRKTKMNSAVSATSARSAEATP